MGAAMPLAEIVSMPGAARSAVQLAMVTGGDVAIAAIVMGTMSAMVLPLVRAWARRLEGRAAAALPLRDVEERLDRIERAVESIAVEVERVSEGQRFVTKLLAEKAPSPLPRATE